MAWYNMNVSILEKMKGAGAFSYMESPWIGNHQITLVSHSPEEWAKCEEWAKSRRLPKRQAGVFDKTFYLKRALMETETLGVAAELAAAKALYSVYDHRARLEGDARDGDFKTPDGRSVEVRFRTHPMGDFLLGSANPEDFRTDLGVLVLISEDFRFLVWGYIAREEFREKARRANFGYGPRLGVSPDSMTSIQQLLKQYHRLLFERIYEKKTALLSR